MRKPLRRTPLTSLRHLVHHIQRHVPVRRIRQRDTALSRASAHGVHGSLARRIRAGAVETIFCILAIRDQIVPPTLNLDDPDEGTEGVDLVPHKAKKREVKAALNNSFGFGGTNASVIVKAV